MCRALTCRRILGVESRGHLVEVESLGVVGNLALVLKLVHPKDLNVRGTYVVLRQSLAVVQTQLEYLNQLPNLITRHNSQLTWTPR